MMNILDSPAGEAPAFPVSCPDNIRKRYDPHPLLLAGIIVVGAALALSLCGRYSVDDAWISFRYVDNIAHGYGAVWNHGERVEGYSNPLWIVLLVPFALMHASLITVAKIIGIACTVGTIFFTARLLEHHGNCDRYAALAASALIAGDTFFAVWTVGGLETPLFALLVVVFSGLILSVPDQSRPNLWPGAVGFLLAVTRPEGALFVVAATLSIAACQARRRRFEIGSWTWLGVFVLLFGAFTLWRYEYYGYLLPNTFWAKTGGGSARITVGLEYIETYATDHFLLIAAVLASAALPAVRSNRLYEWSFLCICAYFAFIVAAGGDWMPAARFVMSVYPLICICCAISITEMARAYARTCRSAAVAVSAALIVILAQSAIAERTVLKQEASWLYGNQMPNVPENEAAAYLHTHANPGDWVAIQEAGKIPYMNPQLSFIDILGLNDAHIAHHVNGLLHYDYGDPGYVLARNPRWLALWVHVRPDGTYAGAMPAVARLIENPETKKRYRLVAQIPQPAPGRPWPKGHVYFIYLRN